MRKTFVVAVLMAVLPCAASADPREQNFSPVPYVQIVAACTPCYTKCERCPRVRFSTVAACKADCDAHGGNVLVKASCNARGPC